MLDRIEKLCGRRPAFHNVDMTDEKGLDAVFDKHPEIDSVIHFAALKVRHCYSRATVLLLTIETRTDTPRI